MLIGRKLTGMVARTLGCRFLGQHWPDADVRWDGECFLSNCRVCEAELRRVGPGIWREFNSVKAAPVEQPVPAPPSCPQILPTANMTQAAQFILEAIVMLDELAPVDPYARAAVTHAQQALDVLIVMPSDQDRRRSTRPN